ncbi:hypothetical protein B0T24DRAFT_259964 [Lasiosphaeria ovina]|uniref:Uncharacterized protein n=1 Tax=Lasiosphaeria ovina TaxID=92902 RepID=A0AAE0KB78_9PEZI|nr:hypothetical protein B0T24DRAFT_259964 [Lasiosphaeria ovina]
MIWTPSGHPSREWVRCGCGALVTQAPSWSPTAPLAAPLHRCTIGLGQGLATSGRGRDVHRLRVALASLAVLLPLLLARCLAHTSNGSKPPPAGPITRPTSGEKGLSGRRRGPPQAGVRAMWAAANITNRAGVTPVKSASPQPALSLAPCLVTLDTCSRQQEH